MSAQQQTLDAFIDESVSVEVVDYVAGALEVPTAIGPFEFSREASFKTDHAIRYEADDGRWARAFWDDDADEALVEANLGGRRTIVRSDLSVGSCVSHGSSSRNHSITPAAYDVLASFLRERVE